MKGSAEEAGPGCVAHAEHWKLQKCGRFPDGPAKNKNVHKLTVKTAGGAGNGRHARDRIMVTIISTLGSGESCQQHLH